jgi:hypothetical protein
MLRILVASCEHGVQKKRGGTQNHDLNQTILPYSCELAALCLSEPMYRVFSFILIGEAESDYSRLREDAGRHFFCTTKAGSALPNASQS